MSSMSQCFNIVHLAVGFTAGQLPVLNGQTTCALWVSVYTKWPAKAAVGTFGSAVMSDLSLECAPKRTSADHSGFMGSRHSSAAHTKANCERDTCGICSRHRVVICPSGG